MKSRWRGVKGLDHDHDLSDAQLEILELEQQIKEMQQLLEKKEQKVNQIKRDLNLVCEYCSRQYCSCQAGINALREAHYNVLWDRCDKCGRREDRCYCGIYC